MSAHVLSHSSLYRPSFSHLRTSTYPTYRCYLPFWPFHSSTTAPSRSDQQHARVALCISPLTSLTAHRRAALQPRQQSRTLAGAASTVLSLHASRNGICRACVRMAPTLIFSHGEHSRIRSRRVDSRLVIAHKSGRVRRRLGRRHIVDDDGAGDRLAIDDRWRRRCFSGYRDSFRTCYGPESIQRPRWKMLSCSFAGGRMLRCRLFGLQIRPQLVTAACARACWA